MAQATMPIGQMQRKNVLQNFVDDLAGMLRIMSRNRVGFAGFLIVAFFILFSLIAPFFIPLDEVTKPGQVYKPALWTSPTGQFYPLGTDFQGRDVWSQIVHGGREPILVAFGGAIISVFISVTLGAFSAYMGGMIDETIMTITDMALAIPQLVLLIVLAGFVQLNNSALLAVLIGVISWPYLLRAIRSQVLSLKQRDYVEAARALDLSRWHIIYNEILPNMMAFIVISFTFAITQAIISQSNLILLGLVPFSGVSWPIILFQAQSKGAIFLDSARGYIYGPIIVIVIFQTAMITMIRSLEEIFNPRLRSDV